MTDQQVLRVLDDGFPIAAVLLTRGGWLKASDRVTIDLRFPTDNASGAVWRIDLHDGQDEAYHSIYVTAESIAGISCRRTEQNAPIEERSV